MNQKLQPTEAELEILQVLWLHQPCTVKLIHEEIGKLRDVGYTTTLKQMQRMLEKGLLSREAGTGKSHNYRATIAREAIQDNLFDRLVDNVFGASVSKLVMHALGKANTSKEEIEEIKKFLDDLDKNQ